MLCGKSSKRITQNILLVFYHKFAFSSSCRCKAIFQSIRFVQASLASVSDKSSLNCNNVTPYKKAGEIPFLPLSE
jgi:hypothetical protein